MKSCNRLFFTKYSKLSVAILLVASSSALLACTEADNAKSVKSVKSVDVANAAGTNAILDEPTAARAVANPQLLKKVSATVYKDINCGCCKEWIDHAQSNGMSTTAQHPENLALFKDRYSVPNDMRSCHTTVTTDGYVFEGHVPAKYVAEFLANPPIQALGLAVPGMPMGSPGMEYQNQFMPYKIMQFNKDGSSEVYASIETSEQQL